MGNTLRTYTYGLTTRSNSSGANSTPGHTQGYSTRLASSLTRREVRATTSWCSSGLYPPWLSHGVADNSVCCSCGFDASEHEYPSMSRHGRHVPTSFYRRFANATRRFADQYAGGRLISVLEGGYSDRALTSGAMAHLTGLAETDDLTADESWWSLGNIIEVRRPACVAPRCSRAVSSSWRKPRRSVEVDESPSPPHPYLGLLALWRSSRASTSRILYQPRHATRFRHPLGCLERGRHPTLMRNRSRILQSRNLA